MNLLDKVRQERLEQTEASLKLTGRLNVILAVFGLTILILWPASVTSA